MLGNVQLNSQFQNHWPYGEEATRLCIEPLTAIKIFACQTVKYRDEEDSFSLNRLIFSEKNIA